MKDGKNVYANDDDAIYGKNDVRNELYEDDDGSNV